MQLLRKFFLLCLLVVGVFGLSGLFNFTANFVFAQDLPTFVFLRDLRQGDSGRDVDELQKILRSDLYQNQSDNFVNESGYFGQTTKGAVISFQNKYADQVLLPAGLTEGTGFVGLWTRLKLNEILLKSVVPSTPVVSAPAIVETPATYDLPSGVSGFLSFDYDGLQLNFLSKNFGVAGTDLILSGSGFEQDSIVNFGSVKVSDFESRTSNSIELKVPSNLSSGRYEISVTVEGETSNTASFMVTRSGSSVPKIDRVEPAIAKFGQKITVYGENFSTTGNTVTSSLGIFSDLRSSDGKTIVFEIEKPEYLDEELVLPVWFGDKENLNWSVRIFVANENGISSDNERAQFIINI